MQELYEQYGRLLFTLAYQLTGTVADAEDAVQDVFVKIYEIDSVRLTQPKAYLCKMVTNRCRDLLKSARRRREQYFGEWLPEPVPTENDSSLEAIVRGELLSYAMLVLLEKLSPVERVVFVLREAMGFDYAAIAEIVDKSEPACRKLISRARGKMGVPPEEQVRPEAASEQWVKRFVSALESGNADTVVAMLASDVTLVSDGGGKAIAAVHPIRSPVSVARFLLGIANQIAHPDSGITFRLAGINGQAGLLFSSPTGTDTIVLLHQENDKLQNLYLIRNPDKLASFNDKS